MRAATSVSRTPVGVATVNRLLDRSARPVAWTLASINVVLLVANVIHLPFNAPGEPYHPVLSYFRWNGDLDGSFIEIFGGAQLIASAIALLVVWRDRRNGVYAAWALLLFTAAADDLFRGHERMRDLLMASVELPEIAGLRPGDVGELAAWALAVGVLGPLLLLAHLRAHGEARRDSSVLTLLLAALVFFAVVVDMAHIVVETLIPPLAATGLSLVETAGELFVMTAIAVVTWSMARGRDTQHGTGSSATAR